MKKLVIIILVAFTSFIGFSLVTKASCTENNGLCFVQNGSEINNITLQGSESVKVYLYARTDISVYGAVIPWTVGSNIVISDANPADPVHNNNNITGASVYYKSGLGNSYTKRLVFDSTSSFPTPNNGLVSLGSFLISAPSLAAGASQTIELKTQESDNEGGVHAVLVGNGSTDPIEVSGTTLTITKAGESTTPKTYKKGDWNDDGHVNADDAVDILRYSAGIPSYVNAYISMPPEHKAAIDFNDEDGINADDAVDILRYAATHNNN